VKLWIDNEHDSYLHWRAEAERVFRRAGKDTDEAKYPLADQLKEAFEESMPELEGMWADLLRAALSETNWQEIAEAMLQDAAEEHGDEDSDDETDE
jgi:hypothetical protein